MKLKGVEWLKNSFSSDDQRRILYNITVEDNKETLDEEFTLASEFLFHAFPWKDSFPNQQYWADLYYSLIKKENEIRHK